MPHVNRGNAEDRDANCAMCSMAGVMDRNTLAIQQALRAAGQSDDALAAAFGHGGLQGKDQQQKVFNSMISFIEQLSAHVGAPVKGYQFGFAGNYKDRAAVAHYMNGTPNGTKFCVWGYMTAEMEGLGAHWNYAQKTAAGIEFRDYQDNVDVGTPFARSPHFLAPRHNREDNNAYQSMIVLYFGQAR